MHMIKQILRACAERNLIEIWEYNCTQRKIDELLVTMQWLTRNMMGLFMLKASRNKCNECVCMYDGNTNKQILFSCLQSC